MFLLWKYSNSKNNNIFNYLKYKIEDERKIYANNSVLI